MAAGDVFGLVVALLVFAYLLYVLFRGRSCDAGTASRRSSLYLVILTALAYPLGRTWTGSTPDAAILRWLTAPERGFYRLVGTRADEEQGWKPYAVTALVFMAVFAVLLYLLLRLQGSLPLNPDGLRA